MPSDYEQISRDNVRRRGEEFSDIGRFLAEEFYSDQTHFIYELLQNADDAIGRRIKSESATEIPKRVRFNLFPDRLEVQHYGQQFTEEDVRGICDILKGTKKEDITQIGRFGIGFKSVYTFTDSPEIHSGDEHFRIIGYIRPQSVPERQTIIGRTLFVFPFDHDSLTPDNAFAQIRNRLKMLGPQTLLFLKNIDEIEWVIDNEDTGVYVREISRSDVGSHVVLIGQSEGQEVLEEEWIICRRPIVQDNSEANASVEVAFRIVRNEKTKEREIVPIADSPLDVYFPTEKLTRLGFLVQGPYQTTPARDNIPQYNAWNQILIEETAHLVVETLEQFRDNGLLTVGVLEAMPIRPSDFEEGSMFRPIYECVRAALRGRALLPTHSGKFVTARDAKLVRGTGLIPLFSPARLAALFDRTEPLYWLSTDITRDRTPDLYRYLVGYRGRPATYGHEQSIEPLVEGMEVDGETVARRLTERFLKPRVDSWIAQLYGYLKDQRDDWKLLRDKPFIRLEDGTHVVPFRSDDLPNAYLPIPESSDFPTVKRDIASVEQAREFLYDFGLREPSILSEVLHNVLPKYAHENFSLDEDEHYEDVTKVARAMNESSYEERLDLLEKVRATFYVLAADTKGNHWFVRPNQAYFSSPDLEEYFSSNPNIYFLSDGYDHDCIEILCELGVCNEVRIERKESVSGVVTISSHRDHQRGLSGFDPGCEIDGLKFALDNITESKAAYIWKQLLMPNIHQISGIVESDTWRTFNGPNYRRTIQKSRMGDLVTTHAWLPDRDGGFHEPNDLSLDDLPDQFIRNEELASALTMRAPESEIAAGVRAEEEAAAGKLGVKIEDIKLIRENQDDFLRFKEDLERKRLQERVQSISQNGTAAHSLTRFAESLQAAFDKPNTYTALDTHISPGIVRNPTLRRERTREEIEQALLEEPAHAERFKRIELRVWEAKNNTVRVFLQEQYAGHCQICDEAFLKRNGEPYFEGLYLVSQTHARWISRPGNVLCLCANCCAKFLNGSVEADSIMQQIHAMHLYNEGGSNDIRLHIRLCDEDTSIRFTEAHMLDLQEIVRLSDNEVETH